MPAIDTMVVRPRKRARWRELRRRPGLRRGGAWPKRHLGVQAARVIVALGGLAGLAAARVLAVRPEPVMFSLSYRNRELVNLFVVAILTGIGFASVYIARQDVVSTGSLSYALFFFALYLAAHVVARFTVPQADPYLLPMAALLTAFGVTEIYRLNPDNAFRQGLWIVDRRRCLLGDAAPAAPRLPSARELQVPVRADGDRTARAARAAGDRRDRSTARASGCTSAASSSSPVSSRRSC